MLSLHLFIMLVLANGTPVIAHRLLRERWSAPIDGGRLWRDRRPLLGGSKTWRGLVVGTFCCTVYSVLVGLGALFGVIFGVLALTGDLLSSFIKRRRGLVASARAIGLDQIPEAAVPMLLAVFWLSLGWLSALAVVVLFVVANILCSPMLFRLGIRRHPH